MNFKVIFVKEHNSKLIADIGGSAGFDPCHPDGTRQYAMHVDLHISDGEERPSPSGLRVHADPGTESLLSSFMNFLRRPDIKEELTNHLSPNHGPVVFIRKGSIILTMLVRKENILDNYMEAEKLVAIEKYVKALALKHCEKGNTKLADWLHSINLYVSFDDIQRVRYFFCAGEFKRAL